jgi:predicted Zn-dependent protease
MALISGVANQKATATAPLAAPQGQTFTHSEAGVKFELPAGWKAKPDGETITVSSADDGLQVVFWVPDEDTFDAAVKELDKELGKTIKNIKTVGKPTQDTHNGMAHYEEAGTGEVDGTAIAWSVDVLGAKKPLIILTFAAPNLYEKNSAGYAKLVNSIKKTE